VEVALVVSAPADVLCFSHLGWDLVFQRPGHLMSHAARDRRVYYVEEPQLGERPALAMRVREGGVVVLTPQLPPDLDAPTRDAVLRSLIDAHVRTERIERPWLWYYTPLALPWTSHLRADAVIYDCMDELSAFRNAPPALRQLEPQLLARADVVFTGGHRLYEAKRGSHPNVHAFPSAVDVAHFATARNGLPEPADQAVLRRPRIGYYGVIDERMDLDLVRDVATARPDWSIVLVGPIVKIQREDVPDLPNIHWLGAKPYAELPSYLAGWDVATMPFARNEATAFISPTKTPEYLAGGRPVVSTSIADVVRPYGAKGLARIADTAADFVAAIEAALAEHGRRDHAAVDAFLHGMSWERTWRSMEALATSAARRPIGVMDRLIGHAANPSSPVAAQATSSHVSSLAAIVQRPSLVARGRGE
jgi:glycosyltransferase involved in cell wall biosynthesis